jgi:hypothetical protein
MLTIIGGISYLLFVDKNNDKTLLDSIRPTFHIVRGVHELDVPSTNYNTRIGWKVAEKVQERLSSYRHDSCG